jgi:hypothetical protein
MTIADATLAVFTLFNTLRFLAYVPQIVKAIKDQSGAEAISFGTWGLFLASHMSAMAYAIENQRDWAMASVFLSNAVGCSVILLIATWKRTQHRRRRAKGAVARRKALCPTSPQLTAPLPKFLQPKIAIEGGYHGDPFRYGIRAGD